MRFTTLLLILIVGSVLLIGASWGLASAGVGDLLGAPPPRMGTSHTAFEWKGSSAVKGHKRVWKFSYGPTAIPGAPNVRIYVDPMGHIVRTDPANLPDLLRAFHSKGY